MEYKLYKASIVRNAYQFSKDKRFPVRLTEKEIEIIERALNENNDINASL